MTNIIARDNIVTPAMDLTCSSCRHQSSCLPSELTNLLDLKSKLNHIIRRNKKVSRNETVSYEGGDFDILYVIREGIVKAYRAHENGQEDIVSFHYPGEIIGLDGIGSGHYTLTVKPLGNTILCGFSFHTLLNVFKSNKYIQRYFLDILGGKLIYEEQRLAIYSRGTATERVCWFILDVFERNSDEAVAPNRIRFGMTRADIGGYLGLTIETVSRTISLLINQKVIAANGKDIIILDRKSIEKNLIRFSR